jgi:TRAP-type C4-dicarboxylate transport system permease small subunit
LRNTGIQPILRVARLLVDTLPRAALGAIMLVALAINGANIVGRYLFGTPIVWADEAMVFLMISAVFLGMAPVTWDARHLKMDIFVAMAPRRVRAVIQVLALALCLAATAFQAVQAFGVSSLMARFGQRSSVLEMPMVWLHGTVTVGLLLAVAAFAIRARLHLSTREGFTVEGEHIRRETTTGDTGA